MSSLCHYERMKSTHLHLILASLRCTSSPTSPFLSSIYKVQPLHTRTPHALCPARIKHSRERGLVGRCEEPAGAVPGKLECLLGVSVWWEAR